MGSNFERRHDEPSETNAEQCEQNSSVPLNVYGPPGAASATSAVPDTAVLCLSDFFDGECECCCSRGGYHYRFSAGVPWCLLCRPR